MKIDLSKFKHEYYGDVKFSDVDSFNVVHNLRYLYWIEWARTEYLFNIGLPKNDKFFSKQFPLMTVHSKIDYYNSLKFTDEYKVFTRVVFIKKSSMGFENYITYKNNAPVARCEGVLVYVDSSTGQVTRLPDILRELVSQFEGSDLKIIKE